MSKTSTLAKEPSEEFVELLQNIFDGSFKDTHSLEIRIRELISTLDQQESRTLSLALHDCRPKLAHLFPLS